VLVIDNWTDHTLTTNSSAPILPQAGKLYDIRMEYCDNVKTATAQLMWTSTSQTGRTSMVIPATNLFARARIS